MNCQLIGLALVLIISSAAASDAISGIERYTGDGMVPHFAVGVLIGAGTELIAESYGMSMRRALLLDLAVGAIAGAAKEGYDSMHPHQHRAEFRTAASTALGASVGGLAVRLTVNF